MKKLLGAIGIIGAMLISPAVAADLGGIPMLPGSTTSDAKPNWTGPVIGGHIGYAWRSHDINIKDTEEIPGIPESCDNDAHLDGGTCYPNYQPASCAVGLNAHADGWCYEPHSRAYCTNGFVKVDDTCYAPGEVTRGKPNEGATPYPDHYKLKVWEKVTTEKVTAPVLGDADDTLYHEAVDAKTIIRNTFLELNPDGFLAGGQIGFNWQPNGSRLVFGVFGDYSYADSDATKDGITVTDGNSYMVGAKLGATLTPDLMAYVLGGYGWQEVSYSEIGDHTFNHWVVGLGAEKKVSRNLGIALEVQHWLADKDTIYNGEGTTVTDERSDTRVLGRVNWHIGGNN